MINALSINCLNENILLKEDVLNAGPSSRAV